MAASTIAPIAIAIPLSDMMSAVSPVMRKGMKASRMATGSVMTGMTALGMCQRKMKTTTETVTRTSMMVDVRLSIAPRISPERS